LPLLAGDAVTSEEARQAAGADLDLVLVEHRAQFAQEELRAGSVDLQNEVGMSLEAAGAPVTSQGLGCDVPLALPLLRPAADAVATDTEALGHLTAGRTRRNRGLRTLAQINGQGCRHRPPPYPVNAAKLRPTSDRMTDALELRWSIRRRVVGIMHSQLPVPSV
jgi:hypothetical protein